MIMPIDIPLWMVGLSVAFAWGSMIKDNYQYIILGKAYLAVIPGIAIMLLVTSFMFLGNNLEEYFKSK